MKNMTRGPPRHGKRLHASSARCMFPLRKEGVTKQEAGAEDNRAPTNVWNWVVSDGNKVSKTGFSRFESAHTFKSILKSLRQVVKAEAH